MVKTQFGTKIKTIRTDNSFELGSSIEAKKIFTEEGIIHQTTCSYTPH